MCGRLGRALRDNIWKEAKAAGQAQGQASANATGTARGAALRDAPNCGQGLELGAQRWTHALRGSRTWSQLHESACSRGIEEGQVKTP